MLSVLRGTRARVLRLRGVTVLAVGVVLAVLSGLLAMAAAPVGVAAVVPVRWLLLAELGVLGAVMALVAAVVPARRR
ncbi:hypothetical protein ACFYNO_16115 [Kitasatospora sp. NPDC006697]|uniref:hypothetical protein n=1 Tax=Kitasatospora sp. NPDC006697 TaxID=3364020 RepID=UPI003688F73C